jgi:hypothetical protein
MRTALLTVLMLRMRVLRLRWGITMTGMTLASGRGAWLGVVVVGMWVLLSGHATLPGTSVVIASFGVGLLCGVVYGVIPRRPRFGVARRPTWRRACVCGFAGGVSVPLIDVFGQPPPEADGSISSATSIVLLAGCVAVGLYLHAQYRRGIHRERGLPPPEHPPSRPFRAARLTLSRMRYAKPPTWVRGAGSAPGAAVSPGVAAPQPGVVSAGEAAADAEKLRQELADSESDLRRALQETGARLASCRGGASGPRAQIATNRALARIIRQDEQDEIG